MERLELIKDIVEAMNVTVSESTDGLIDAEIKAGCKMLKFTCPKCGKWIGNAVCFKTSEGYYQVIRSGCSSEYEGIDQPCRTCQEYGGK